MKFQFKIQQFQTDAVNAVTAVFAGQPYQDRVRYIRDVGSLAIEEQISISNFVNDENMLTGFENASLKLNALQLLDSIKQLQTRNNIKISNKLEGHLGACSLDVEMETGTGKTYVYIKTIFELNKRYGWSKFIVVVPSIAIREGVYKSFQMMQDHFMEHYGKKARFFIYNSKNLPEIDNFSSSSGINVMIINIQAFNARGKDNQRIRMELDEFGSRKPIDVIAANKPILILDEPQKMGGDKTQKSLEDFNPLFSLNYSATHKDQHNPVYVLDAVDAYNKRLVKKIEVKGFEVKNFRGTDRYLFLDDIILSPNKPPKAKMEFEIGYNKSINRESRLLDTGSDLYALSRNMEQYKGYMVSEIDPILGSVTFTNGEVIHRGEVVGDVSEQDMRRIQIRETIKSHFEKERRLYAKGIKTLSLFFIDRVANYRSYDDDGNEELGEYGKIFEEEYARIVKEHILLLPENEAYRDYLINISMFETHTGYFSIDKKGHAIDGNTKRGSDESDDISAYDLILKNKELLLSFENPVRFIFSHSALREGWDNPNVFQICTLKHGGDSSTQKRQEVGRGLRLCVNQNGERMDAERCGDMVHDDNVLTVIASEGYKDFVGSLQKGIQEALYDRPTKATDEYFFKKTVLFNGKPISIDAKQAKQIYKYLIKNDYVDDEDHITPECRDDLKNTRMAPLPEELQPMAEDIFKLIQGVYDPSVLDELVGNGLETKIPENALNENFAKKEFQTLWDYINHQYAYTVEFDSDELITKAIAHINDKLFVTRLQYHVTTGSQENQLSHDDIKNKSSFIAETSRSQILELGGESQIEYDLIGKLAEGAALTRKTTAAILSGIDPKKFELFSANPEEFITKTIRLIKEQKATVIVEHIQYNTTEKSFDSGIFAAEKVSHADKAYRAKKNVQDYVITDGKGEGSREWEFAENLDLAEEVCVYAKLPKGFYIPTPVGHYSPDWAIAFNAGTVKHVFFIAETKGTMESLNLRPIEQAKIKCARKLFNEISTSKVKYHDVDSYQSLLNVMQGL